MFLLPLLVFVQIFSSDWSQSVEVQPFCPDLKPPFSSHNRARLCLYRQYGCCTDGHDFVLLKKYIEISRELRRRGLGRACNGMIVDLLCENCSPYSGQLFNLGQSIPRFCAESCERIYQQCSQQIKLTVQLTTPDNVAILEAFDSVQKFCDSMSHSHGDSELCFPESENVALDVERILNVTETSCVCLEKVADDLRNPIIFRHADDGSRRFFIGEQIGRIYIYTANGTRIERPFLDINSKIVLSTSPADERGLLGLEFHPGYFFNGKFYIYYTTRSQLGRVVTRLSEFFVDILDPNLADPNSERVLLEIEQPFGNHNGGEVLFDNDGYLLLFVGDGGAGGDPFNNAQNRQRLLGKVLRIDVNRKDVGKEYAIPSDNPFIDDNTTLSEIYALGIRNIWRCGKDRGDQSTDEGKGRILCGDVGQRRWEELNLIQKGGNYGWRGREGFQCFREQQCNKTEPEVFPIFTYGREVGQSITGGNFYRGCASPNLNGYYIYGDYASGTMFTIKETAPGNWENKELPLCPSSKCTNGLQAEKERFILSFGEDQDGEVHVLVTDRPSSGNNGGKVYKIVDPMRRGNPDTCGNTINNNPIGVQQSRGRR